MATPKHAPDSTLSSPADSLTRYTLSPDTYDELAAPDGTIRPHWQALIDGFGRLTARDKTAAIEKASRLLHENGVTYTMQDDATGGTRPWQLDLLPMIIDGVEWRNIELGLIQRTELLNDILCDIYGDQQVLKQGLLPAGLIFGNPEFLRPAYRLPLKNERHLLFLAYDLARAPNGSWWVLRHRTQSPAGAGFALENRVVTSRCLPDLFENSDVQRLASFFRAFSDHFLSLSRQDDPTAVVLSGGPGGRNYFEHAYLARYLGFNVVEGSDLAVRNDRLFMKTVEGLKPVDLILRRVKADQCDPLELRSESAAGVPGLLQVARAGNVTIANSLGSGLVETDAIMSFLPGLCRHFLQQELLLPSIATWWCGQGRERDYVLAHLDRLDVRTVATDSGPHGDGRRLGLFPPSLDEAERRARINEIKRRGHRYFGEESMRLSTMPRWQGDDEFQPAPMVLRVYVAATSAGYRVMPGGLTRISPTPESTASWIVSGDVTKDTWVIADKEVESFSWLAEREDEQRLRRSMGILPSRSADNLFWLGRYAERAEAAVRLFRSLVIRLSGETGASRHLLSPERVATLLVAQKHLSARRARRATQLGREGIESELRTMLFDADSHDGLAPVLQNVRRTAEVVRERLSFDTFRILRDLTDLVRDSHGKSEIETADALQLLNRMIQYIAAFNGMVMENMTRGFGWQFLDMGRRLERLRTMAQLIQRVAVRGDPGLDGALELLLELADSTMTYRGRYRDAPQLAAVLDLLLADASNPRSAIFQVVAISQQMSALPRESEPGVLAPDERIMTQIESELRLADVHRLATTVNRFDTRNELDRLARHLERSVEDLSNLIADRYFSHASPKRVSG